MNLIFMFVNLVDYSPILATIVALPICALAGFILSRTTAVQSQRRLMVTSFSVGAGFGVLMALYDVMPAVSFYAVLLGMFFFIPVSAFLLVTSLFALLFSIIPRRRVGASPAVATDLQNTPNARTMQSTSFGRKER